MTQFFVILLDDLDHANHQRYAVSYLNGRQTLLNNVEVRSLYAAYRPGE